MDTGIGARFANNKMSRLESNKDVEMIFRKLKLHIYIIHEVVN